MTVLLICAACGFALGLYGSKNRKSFIPALALIIGALIVTSKRWMPHIGIEDKIEGESFSELMSNFIGAMSPIGQLAIPVFVGAIVLALYVGTLIAAYKESHAEDSYKKKIRILTEHGMKEFD